MGSWQAPEHLASGAHEGVAMGLGKKVKDKAKEIKGVKGKAAELTGKAKLKGEKAKSAVKK
jgi:hypothetical protein